MLIYLLLTFCISFQSYLAQIVVTEETTAIGKTLVLTSTFDCANKDPFDPSLNKGGLPDLISQMNSSPKLSDTTISAIKLVLKLSKGT